MELRAFDCSVRSPLVSMKDNKDRLSATELSNLSMAPLAARPVLGNLTNKIECASRLRLNYRPNDGKSNENALTAAAVVVGGQHPVCQPSSPHYSSNFSTVLRPEYPTSMISTSQTAPHYDSNNKENYLLPSTFVSSSQSRGFVHSCFSRSPLPKRPRCDLRETHPDLTSGIRHADPLDVEESKIPRPSFKSKLAYDIVRAAFADRVQLEELLAECRRADFAISALDRSPIDRMMEATDYIVGIMAYEQIRETKEYFRVGNFLATAKQPHLTTDMVTTLADWLIEVQEVFAFNHETIHLAWGLMYAYFDRGEPLARREIQLMACAAIMVACKHEESKMPLLSEFQYITDGAYKREEFIEMERKLLIAIDFAVHRPNPYVFLRRYARVLDAHTGAIQFMSRFLLEAGMHCHSINLMRESRKAAAVLWLARVVLRNPSYVSWTRRTDVRQLRHLVRSSRPAQLFYERCTNTKLSGQLAINRFSHVFSGSEDMDLITSSPSEPGSAIFSDPRFAENVDHWIQGGFSSAQPLTLNHIDSETHTRTPLAPSAQIDCLPTSAERRSLQTLIDESTTDLSPSIMNDLEAMKSEEEQRSPFWPPILEHITGYKETDLIPLAIRYHTTALQLIAEVARGGRLAADKGFLETGLSSNCTGSVDSDTTMSNGSACLIDEEDENHTTEIQQRSISPGGHCLRRQAVSKYCSSAFLNVADAYPQLAFENFVPYFPSVQCSDTCTCFICVNLIRRVS